MHRRTFFLRLPRTCTCTGGGRVSMVVSWQSISPLKTISMTCTKELFGFSPRMSLSRRRSIHQRSWADKCVGIRTWSGFAPMVNSVCLYTLCRAALPGSHESVSNACIIPVQQLVPCNVEAPRTALTLRLFFHQLNLSIRLAGNTLTGFSLGSCANSCVLYNTQSA
jgi:hypothetical protein